MISTRVMGWTRGPASRLVHWGPRGGIAVRTQRSLIVIQPLRSAQTMEQIDVAVIGAGVVGLASALAIASRGRSVCILEREARPGLGTSTHNSQVIHAGIYYPPGQPQSTALRERRAPALRVLRAAQRPPSPQRKADRRARRARGAGARGAACARAIDNGVEGMEIVEQAFIREREPHLKVRVALFSPNTGMLEAEALVQTLARLCREKDAFLLPGSPLVGADATPDGIVLRTPAESIAARSVVNAAGLYADEVSEMLGGQDVSDLSVPGRVRGTGARQARPRQRARLSAAAHAWTGRAHHQDDRRQRHARTDSALPGSEGRLRGRPDSARRLSRAGESSCSRRSRSRI